jgi:hypothetical protein
LKSVALHVRPWQFGGGPSLARGVGSICSTTMPRSVTDGLIPHRSFRSMNASAVPPAYCTTGVGNIRSRIASDVVPEWFGLGPFTSLTVGVGSNAVTVVGKSN